MYAYTAKSGCIGYQVNVTAFVYEGFFFSRSVKWIFLGRTWVAAFPVPAIHTVIFCSFTDNFLWHKLPISTVFYGLSLQLGIRCISTLNSEVFPCTVEAALLYQTVFVDVYACALGNHLSFAINPLHRSGNNDIMVSLYPVERMFENNYVKDDLMCLGFRLFKWADRQQTSRSALLSLEDWTPN